MKIDIQGQGHRFQLHLPTGLLCSRFLLRILLRFVSFEGRQWMRLPPESADTLLRELRRIKRKHGTWELVEVKSADGKTVHVTL